MRRRQIANFRAASAEAVSVSEAIAIAPPEDIERFVATVEKRKGPKPCPKCGAPGYYFHVRNCRGA